MYKGQYVNSGDKITSNYFLIEPAMTFGLGGRVFEFQITAGFPMRPNFEPLKSSTNARTLPANIGFGLKFFFGRSKNKLE